MKNSSEMQKGLTLLLLLMASLQVFAIDTRLPALHWTLPTTLEGIRQEQARIRPVAEPMPASIMCRGQLGRMSVADEAFSTEGEMRYWTVGRDLTPASVPYLALGAALHAVKWDVRKVNNDINKGFHNKADDYVQFAPLLLTWGLKATGYEGRSKWGRLMVSNTFSAAIMAGLVNGIKYTASEQRPDGSSSNSFPSGHTATAFMAATILHKEYGLTRSLWYSIGGYTVATGIGAFRVMNNRHWVSDVMMGAGIGILSTEMGYALSDVVFKDKHTTRREMEGLNDMTAHPSFFSLQAGAGILMGNNGAPDDIAADGGPSSIKHGISSVISAEAAYFLNPYLGLGLRVRVNSTAVTPRWNDARDIWTYGTLRYNATTDRYEHPKGPDADFRHGNSTRKDQLSSFDFMGGVYGQLPLNKRMSLGGKLLFGYRKLGDVWWWADLSGNDDEKEDPTRDYLSEMLENKSDITTYDYIQAISLDGKKSFIFGTGIYFSYALKHNIVWRTGLDYDFTHVRYDYEYRHYSLADVANAILSTGKDYADTGIRDGDGSFRRSIHQLTPSFGICFAF